MSSNMGFIVAYSVSGHCTVMETSTEPAPPVAPGTRLKMVRKCVCKAWIPKKVVSE